MAPNTFHQRTSLTCDSFPMEQNSTASHEMNATAYPRATDPPNSSPTHCSTPKSSLLGIWIQRRQHEKMQSKEHSAAAEQRLGRTTYEHILAVIRKMMTMRR